MGGNPMGPSGVDIDMVSGRPVDPKKKPEIQKSKATEHLRGTIKDSLDLAVELQGSPVVRMLVKKLTDRLTALASQDPECKALEDILTGLHFKLEVAPATARKRLQQIMGSQALQLLEEGEAEPL